MNEKITYEKTKCKKSYKKNCTIAMNEKYDLHIIATNNINKKNINFLKENMNKKRITTITNRKK